MMSLVDYASSSDEESKEDEQIKENSAIKRQRFEAGPSSAVHAHNMTSRSLETVSTQSRDVKLPDASFLLNSPVVPSIPNASDHSSRVATALSESAVRKREFNGSPATYPRSKIPKGTLLYSKRVPDTIDGRLLPPQLAGRSNVVTEDIS